MAHIDNHGMKTQTAVVCPSCCRIIVKREIDPSNGDGYYAEIRTGEKHLCHLAIEESLKPQLLRSHTREEVTKKANQAIIRINFIDIIQTLLNLGNEYFLQEEGLYRLVPDNDSGKKEK